MCKCTKIWVMVIAFVLLLGLQPAARAGDIEAYMDTSTGHFGLMDLTTGVYSDIGNMGQLLGGLGVFGGLLYSEVSQGITLYQVNPATGALTAVPTTGAAPAGGFGDNGSTTTGLDVLDGVGSVDYNLYFINSITGVVTLVGSTGVAVGGPTTSGLSTGSSTLYFTNANSLYTINTSTGLATFVGDMGNTGAQVDAMVFSGGTLYGGEGTPTVQVLTINPSTGTASAGPALTNSNGHFYGLAPANVAPVPEPSSFALLLVGVAAVLFALNRRVAP